MILQIQFTTDHPVCRCKENIEMWHLYGRGIAKIRLFSNIELCYLFFHTAISLIAYEEIFGLNSSRNITLKANCGGTLEFSLVQLKIVRLIQNDLLNS